MLIMSCILAKFGKIMGLKDHKLHRSKQREKKQKLLTKEGLQNNNYNMGVVGEDRISELTDSLLLHILSLLPTKCSVSTSVLSKRWRYLWTSVPILDFREWRSLRVTATDDDFRLQTERFMNCVERMLSFHDDMPNIKKLYLEIDEYFDESRVKELISTVIRRNVEELNLCVYSEVYSLFPPCFFTCESLTTLDLNMIVELDLPNSISFPRLKILKLTHITFVDESSTQQFFSNCPVLEELILSECRWVDMNVVSISAPALKCLCITGPSSYGLNDCGIEIYAPSVLSLLYEDCVAKDYVLRSFSSLVDAEIDFLSIWETRREIGCRATKLLGGLSNVKLLILSGNAFEISPNLESLVFAQASNLPNSLGFHESISNDYDDDWTLNSVPQCLLLHLKSFAEADYYSFFRFISKFEEQKKTYKAVKKASNSLHKLCG
ncbi:F-box domain [Macleaya cordata]|uniref:F-box domain n=1 Tax=Macleaya cordata TaxID=56857 RepID=A0A200QFQ3_MACCD|nr:F-box domain [Macleaya cordata]